MRTMIQLFKLSALCAALTFAPMQASTRYDSRGCGGCIKTTLCEIRDELAAAVSCGTVIPITQKDIGTTGTVLTKSGVYCLSEDIVFSPVNPISFNPVTITDPNPAAGGASGFAAVSNNTLQGIFLIEGGNGYTNPTVSVGGPGTGAVVTASLSSPGGSITNFNVVSGGSNYKNTVQVAITIAGSNIRLMCGNRRLSQAGSTLGANVPAYTGVNNPSSQTPFAIGILIPDLMPTSTDVNQVALESIYIEGDQAIIDGFSMAGIYCQGHVADVRLSNLTIENCGVLASYYLRPFATYYPNGYPEGLYDNLAQVPFYAGAITIGESDVQGLGPYFFTQRFGVAQNRVSSVIINNVSCLNNFSTCINIANSTNVYINDSHFDDTFTDDPNVLVIGVALGLAEENYEDPSVMTLVMENSTCNGTAARGDYTTEFTVNGAVFGAFAARMHDFFFKNCHFDNTSATFATDALGAITLAFANSDVHDGTWEDCTFSGVSALGPINIFHISGNTFFGGGILSSHNIRLTRCVASNAQMNSQLQLPQPVLSGNETTGFVFFYIKNLYVEDCIAQDIVMNGPALYSGAGYQIIDGAEFSAGNYEQDNLVFRGCIAQRVLSTQGAPVSGFLFDPYEGPGNRTRTVVFEDCIAEGCLSLVPTMTQFSLVQSGAAGFTFQSTGETDLSYPVSYINCQALNNQGNASIGSAGFYAGSADLDKPVQGHSYYNCDAIRNVYGFAFQNDKQMIVRNCRADLNVARITDTSADGVVGEGFTDLGLGLAGTPATVSQSFSLFENNRAFENGAGSTHFGENGNYNVVYGAGLEQAFVPTLTGNLTNPGAVVGGNFFPQTPYFAPVHNISITEA